MPSGTRSADEPASLKFISSCSSRTEVFSVRSEDTCPLIHDDPYELRAIRRETSSLRSDDTPQRGRFPFRIGSGGNRGLVLFPFCPSLSCAYNATEVHAAIDMPRPEPHRTSANMLKFHKIASSTPVSSLARRTKSAGTEWLPFTFLCPNQSGPDLRLQALRRCRTASFLGQEWV